MKKKILALLLAGGCVASLSACADKGGNQHDNSTQKETDVVGGDITPDAKTEETDTVEKKENDTTEADGGEYEYPSEDAGTVVRESPIGYSMPYDPTIFTLDDTGKADVFTYNTAETLDAPVYVSVQPYPDMDAQTLAEGLALQSGKDDVMVDETSLGADDVESKLVYIEKEADGLKQIQVFYAIPKGKGSLLMEIGSYAGVSEMIDSKIEEMLKNFRLTAE